MLVEVVQNFDHSFDQTLLYLSGIQEHQFKFKSHRAHHFSCHGPIGGDGPTQDADHVEHFFDEVMRFHNVS